MLSAFTEDALWEHVIALLTSSSSFTRKWECAAEPEVVDKSERSFFSSDTEFVEPDSYAVNILEVTLFPNTFFGNWGSVD